MSFKTTILARMPISDPATFLHALFQHTVSAVSAEACLPPYLGQLCPPLGRTVVLGAGKAAAAMACTFERHWTGDVQHLSPPQEIGVIDR